MVRSQNPSAAARQRRLHREGLAFGSRAAAVFDTTPDRAPVSICFDLPSSLPPACCCWAPGQTPLPVAQMASFLGWDLTVIDHRPHHARAERFPAAELCSTAAPPALSELLADSHRSASIAAAIVMSHHFLSDRAYPDHSWRRDHSIRRTARARSTSGTSALTDRTTGSAARRPPGSPYRARSWGAASPEAIALAIAAELQGRLRGRQRIEPMS